MTECLLFPNFPVVLQKLLNIASVRLLLRVDCEMVFSPQKGRCNLCVIVTG